MAPGLRCRICDGELTPSIPGVDARATADALRPSCHEPGRHGQLMTCAECGSVEQPALPSGDALHALYRETQDASYLAEEIGRRATAGRLLDLIGERVPAGRLLDVGCGPGLLLDEARARGYEAVGLELSRDAAAHASETLGLDVREEPLESFEDLDGFDAVVLADVIEHLEDPVGGIERCVALLRPGGVLCVVTPDPSSAAARVAGRRWWGYLPAHTCLLPRRTLRELLLAAGLVVTADVALVRTFAARRWVAGLAERAGRLEPPIARVAGRLPADASLSLSLGDERVVLAQRVDVLEAPEPAMEDRGQDTAVHVVLPAYRAAATIPAVVAEMPRRVADRALLVDDCSDDDTTAVALEHGLDVLRHPVNLGYGGSQKSGYTRALLDGADVIVMVHADDQYDPGLVPRIVAPIVAGDADMVIGSRLLEDHAIAGGMPRWKWLGNRLLTEAENRAFGVHFSEYHTGYRAFSAELLRSIPFLRNSDGFVFDQQLFAQVIAQGARVLEVPIPTRYFHEASSVGFTTSVRYGLGTLRVLARYRADAHGRPWSLLRRPAADWPEREARITRPAA
jgi:2-polyprenyl-3-methyl-5-hydroxy-6-metoxy-1,4-benzoquinol methylase